MVPFESIPSTVQAAPANVTALPYTTKLPWSCHRFHVSRLFQTSGMRDKRVHDEDNVY